MFRSLKIRNYRMFAIGGAVSNVGTWLQRTAQDWLILDLTHGSAAALGTATALQFLPMLLFGMFGGVLADRYPKRPLLITAQTMMAVLAVAIGLLTVTGAAQEWHVYVMAFTLGMISCVEVPTRQAFVVEMVGRDDLPNAIALNSSSFNLARVVGPAVAGMLIYLLGGTGPLFLINALTFAAVISSLVFMRTSELHPSDPVPRAKGQLREGLAYVMRHEKLLMPILLIAFVSMFSQAFSMSIALMAREEFQAGASSFGLASSMFAVGALAGALLAARRSTISRRVLFTGAIAFGVFQVAAGLAPSYLAYLALLVPAGIALITVNTAANAAVQLATSPEMRGRVMGIYMLVFVGGSPIGATLVGWLSEIGGPRAGAVFAGLFVLAGTAMAVLVTRIITGRVARRRAVPATA
ncbi:MFS transporter [Nonomuraea sp. MCN248]|uniref:MFS transporter n=1 Tax=Nonomuraea corallina TaxID=2989783 RepID=A0ABT4SAP2_9ACTN|nr:MFS transporter [Nonomuraea corallina]MDA0634283.1 MFS transporter [Nonomuraea corallina]